MKKMCFYIMFAIFSMSFMVYDNDKKYDAAYFKAGEELQFIMYYGIVNGGSATITLKETILNNKKLLHARASMKTTGVADWIFGIEDVYESYFDENNKCKPVKAIRN
ncbi:MAG: DUF3108 domain-containing protein, partial [Bacteroidales bacterium]|nr:DUF3108 domain-containing protein [Bacteroidales bacterium]